MKNSFSKRSWLVAGSMVLIVLVIAMRSHFWNAQAVIEKPQSLSVTKVVSRDIKHVVRLPGEFIPFQEVDVDAKVRGYVRKLNVDVGDVVREGEVLATLDIPEIDDQLRQATAAVARAEQEADRSRVEYDDDKAIYDRLAAVMHERPELIAQQDIDLAKTKADSSRATYTALQSGIDEARANLGRLRSIVNYAQIIAPFDGTVTQRFVSAGALVGETSGPSAARAIFHLSEVQKLRLVITPPESEVPYLAVGTIAMIAIDALHQTVEAPVSRISHQLTADTRTMHVEIDYANPKRAVAPGMFAQVSLPLEEHANAVAVPLGAVHERKNDEGVAYVLGGDGSVQARKLTLGLSGSNFVEVESGLKIGETVAMDTVPVADGKTRYAPKLVDTGAASTSLSAIAAVQPD